MTHLNFHRDSGTTPPEAFKEGAPASLKRALASLRCAAFSTLAAPWTRQTRRRNPPKRNGSFRALFQCRASSVLLAMMCGALVAPTFFFFIVTNMTSKEASSPKFNLRDTKSEEGRAPQSQRPIPPQQPPPPPPTPPRPRTTTTVVVAELTVPPAAPHKLHNDNQEIIRDPLTPSTTATPKTKPTSSTFEVDTRAKRAEQDKKAPKPKTGEQDERKVEKEKPLECIKNHLWDKTVDTSTYDYGCKEIEEMLQGAKELIGHGNIRDVYRINYKGRYVVAKVLREDFSLRAGRRRVENIHRWEAAALDAVRGHPNIVGLLGICGHESVSEYYGVHLGDLVLGASTLLPISKVVPMALDAARGLQALHEVSGGAIVHYDIKPQQLMIDAYGRVKINDLNMCHFTDADAMGNLCPFTAGKSNVGPWRSPENIAGEILSEKLDVYSLAMVYYSMLAGKPPFQGQTHASKMIQEGIPPSIDPSWNTGFVEIIQAMWGRDPTSRLSARQIVSSLESLMEELDLDERPF